MKARLLELITYQLVKEQNAMSKRRVTAKTADGNKSYTVNESSGKYYCYKVNSGLFSSDDKVGEARSLEDALSVIKSHASKWGTVYSVNIG